MLLIGVMIFHLSSNCFDDFSDIELTNFLILNSAFYQDVSLCSVRNDIDGLKLKRYLNIFSDVYKVVNV